MLPKNYLNVTKAVSALTATTAVDCFCLATIAVVQQKSALLLKSSHFSLRQTYAYLALNVNIDDVNVYSVICYEKAIEKKALAHGTVQWKAKEMLQ